MDATPRKVNITRLRQGATWLLLAGLCAVTWGLTDNFLTWYNLVENLLTNAVPIAIIAFGMTLVMIGGGFDLSVGSNVATSAVVLVLVLQAIAGAHPVVAILVALAATLATATLLGALNGAMIAYVGVNPFVVTLSTMYVYRSTALVLARGGQSIQVPAALIEPLRSLYWDGVQVGKYCVPYPVFIAVGVFLAAYYLLRLTRHGYYMYALGGNERASWLAGIRTRRVKFATYALLGLACGVAAFVLATSSRTAEASGYQGYEMMAIAAVIVGGTPLGGGTGGLFGTLAGLLLLELIENLLSQFQVPSPYHPMVAGAIILVVVAADSLMRRQTRT